MALSLVLSVAGERQSESQWRISLDRRPVRICSKIMRMVCGSPKPLALICSPSPRVMRIFLFVKANQAGLQRAVFDAIPKDFPRDTDYTELVTATVGLPAAPSGSPMPPASTSRTSAKPPRIGRDRYDTDGALISKEIVHAVTSLEEDRASLWHSTHQAN